MIQQTQPPPCPRYSVVIPTRRLESDLADSIHQAFGGRYDTQVIVVEPDDGPPVDPDIGLPPNAQRCHAPRGRGTQCNAGARRARGAILVFLHDDTQLPADAWARIEAAFTDPQVGVACFRLRFDRRHALLRIYAFFSRFDSVWTTFGDQGIVVRQTTFEALGGFPDWPLFEDVELTRRARRARCLVKLASSVTTAATRFERNGILLQQWHNAVSLVRFLRGASPWALAQVYEKDGRSPPERD